ncbi:hypothetical protein IGI04_003681 [Brassica rapa subsp. trilocularis]|uniref:Uncharacterized protein n=1 Tax=Brassica rapa subsp. trilocularis TaxID=1813537 RepID=A0ABQ7P2M9_BRACM|nr:hypothetical protein IGI04_003681 [Brassica rapa subsp. trilocularis]
MTLERPLRATYQGRSRSRATRWSDTPKSLATSRPETPKIGPGATPSSRSALFCCRKSRFLKDLFAIYFGRFALGKTYVLNIFCSHLWQIIFYLGEIHKNSLENSILDHPRSNPYAHEFSFPLVKKLKRGEKVTIGRTEHGSDLPERHHEVAVSHFSERPS